MDKKIEAILFFKNEPVSYKELAELSGASESELSEVIQRLQDFYQERGIVLVTDGERVSFGTHPSVSSLIEQLEKEEASRDLGKAGLEVLAIILYKGPLSRREIDYIRGVNSGFTLRSLLIRGLIEKIDSRAGERSYTYKPTLELLKHLGVTRVEDLPEYAEAYAKLEEFVNTESQDGEDI